MSAMDVKQSSSTALTRWMGFHAGHVSNGYQAEQGHSTYLLDGISCKQCQQWISSRAAAQHSLPGWDFMQAMSAIDIKQGSCTALTSWMGFHAGNISNENQVEEMHINSLPGYDLMQAILVLKINFMICLLPPVNNIQTLSFYQFNPYICSLKNCLLANYPKLSLPHLHTKDIH